MTASSRFGYSMVAGAVLAGVPVGWEMKTHPAKIAAQAATYHQTASAQRLTVFVTLAAALGLVLFVVATIVAAKRRPQRTGAAAAAPVRPRRQGSYR